jgi:hypothetical protein
MFSFLVCVLMASTLVALLAALPFSARRAASGARRLHASSHPRGRPRMRQLACPVNAHDAGLDHRPSRRRVRGEVR